MTEQTERATPRCKIFGGAVWEGGSHTLAQLAGIDLGYYRLLGIDVPDYLDQSVVSEGSSVLNILGNGWCNCESGSRTRPPPSTDVSRVSRVSLKDRRVHINVHCGSALGCRRIGVLWDIGHES